MLLLTLLLLLYMRQKIVALSLLQLYSGFLFPNAWLRDLPPPLFWSGHRLMATSVALL